MRLLVLLSVFVLAGCATAVPVKHTFPEAPPILQVTCPPLKQIAQDTESLSELLTIVTQNYATYHECSYLLSKWQEWYQIQKKIFDQGN